MAQRLYRSPYCRKRFSEYPVTLNPWRYNSSHPTHNQATYDLWVDVIVDGKTNRISNWSDKPDIVGP